MAGRRIDTFFKNFFMLSDQRAEHKPKQKKKILCSLISSYVQTVMIKGPLFSIEILPGFQVRRRELNWGNMVIVRMLKLIMTLGR